MATPSVTGYLNVGFAVIDNGNSEVNPPLAIDTNGVAMADVVVSPNSNGVWRTYGAGVPYQTIVGMTPTGAQQDSSGPAPGKYVLKMVTGLVAVSISTGPSGGFYYGTATITLSGSAIFYSQNTWNIYSMIFDGALGGNPVSVGATAPSSGSQVSVSASSNFNAGSLMFRYIAYGY